MDTFNPLGSPLAEPVKAPDLAPAGSEFERFEDLTRKVIQVPKKEIDETRTAD